jgi:hypothetical protein
MIVRRYSIRTFRRHGLDSFGASDIVIRLDDVPTTGSYFKGVEIVLGGAFPVISPKGKRDQIASRQPDDLTATKLDRLSEYKSSVRY